MHSARPRTHPATRIDPVPRRSLVRISLPPSQNYALLYRLRHPVSILTIPCTVSFRLRIPPHIIIDYAHDAFIMTFRFNQSYPVVLFETPVSEVIDEHRMFETSATV